jgi:hypothetical protein
VFATCVFKRKALGYKVNAYLMDMQAAGGQAETASEQISRLGGVFVCLVLFLAAAACGALGNEITTIKPGPPWPTEQTVTGNLASTTTILPSLCPAFGTTQPLSKGAAFFIFEPSTDMRLIEATTCVPAQGAIFRPSGMVVEW